MSTISKLEFFCLIFDTQFCILLQNMYDLAIIGGGPAGVSAGIYASRKRLKTIFITEEFGGQSIVSSEIQNWIGTPKISGTDLAKALEVHLREYAADIIDIKVGRRTTGIMKQSDGTFSIMTNKGETYNAKTLLLTVGSTRRKLTVPGAAEFENKGITYCASCDGPLFAGKDVAVIGGGNAGFETAAQLLAYCNSVTLLHKNADFKADPVTVKKVLLNPKMKSLLSVDLVEVKGGPFVTGLVYKEQTSGETKELSVQGVFVEIGLIPSTDIVKGLLELNPYGQIIVNPKSQMSSVSGVWAAGDCTDALYHQNNIASGDGVKAIEDIYMHLHTK